MFCMAFTLKHKERAEIDVLRLTMNATVLPMSSLLIASGETDLLIMGDFNIDFRPLCTSSQALATGTEVLTSISHERE